MALHFNVMHLILDLLIFDFALFPVVHHYSFFSYMLARIDQYIVLSLLQTNTSHGGAPAIGDKARYYCDSGLKMLLGERQLGKLTASSPILYIIILYINYI